MSKEKIKTAQKAYRMARKLLPEFFTPEELVNSSCVPPKPGKTESSRADMGKMDLLLGMYRIGLYVICTPRYFILHCVYPLYDVSLRR